MGIRNADDLIDQSMLGILITPHGDSELFPVLAAGVLLPNS